MTSFRQTSVPTTTIRHHTERGTATTTHDARLRLQTGVGPPIHRDTCKKPSKLRLLAGTHPPSIINLSWASDEITSARSSDADLS